MIKRLLIGVAGTPALQAKIDCTLDLAKKHEAEVSLLSVVDRARLAAVGPVPIGAGHYAANLRKGRIERSHKLDEDAIAQFEAAAAKAQVSLRVLRAEGDPLDIIGSAWRYHDLCIMGLRGWFDHEVMPDPEDSLQQLISRSVRPILAVAEQPRPVRKALIAYNGSLESAKTMKQFVQLALWQKVALHIVCVGKPKSGETVQTLLQDAGDYCRLHGYETSVAARDGQATEVLQKESEACGADVIAMGSSHRRLLLSRRFGKNALALIKHAEVPLFLSH